MAQLRDALQKGGYVYLWGFHKRRACYKAKEGDWGSDVSMVAFNALQNRGELRRLDTSGYRTSEWVLKSAGYTKMEVEAKVNAAKAKLEAANRVLAEAQAARDLAATEWANAFNELSKVGMEVPNEDQ